MERDIVEGKAPTRKRDFGAGGSEWRVRSTARESRLRYLFKALALCEREKAVGVAPARKRDFGAGGR